ncbi:MAG: hypothetical protein ACF8QF_11010 [Phycisphaerales bacterium]
MRAARLLISTLVVAPGAHAHALGRILSDASLFERIPHTLIDFESVRNGEPAPLDEGQSRSINAGEYSATGLYIFWEPQLGNSLHPDVDSVQAQAASPNNVLFITHSANTGAASGFGWNVNRPVRAWGVFVMIDATRDLPRPVFNVYQDDGVDSVLLDSFTFEGDLVDGRIGDIEYGYVGYTSDIPFAAVTIDNFTVPFFDDLRFSAIPTPGAGAAFALLGLGALARRRRPGC